MKKLLTRKNLNWALLLLVVVYIVFKSINMGADINVYLFASKQIFSGENIYQKSIYNYYLYSPFFAILLRPLSIFGLPFGRVVWGLLNLVLVFRLWHILSTIVKDHIELSKKMQNVWMIGVIIIAAGFLNHNIILGQITIVVLWLTFEGLYQVLCRERHVLGAFLLALGVNIKIIPMLALYYLFFKGKIKALAYSSGFIILFLILPSVIVGHDYNKQMHLNWWETINPTGDSKYVFENDQKTQSLSAVLPAYFYDFKDKTDAKVDLPRIIVAISHKTLVSVLQTTRILLALSILLLVFYNRKQRSNTSLWFLWEFAYLALVTVLIFPHQQKYAMLYYVPAGAYLLLYSILAFKIKDRINRVHQVLAIVSVSIMFLSFISARDIIGKEISGIFDYYHWLGLANIFFLVLLYSVKPDLILQLQSFIKHSEVKEG